MTATLQFFVSSE